MAKPLTSLPILFLFASIAIADDLYSDPLAVQSDDQPLSPLYSTNSNLPPAPLNDPPAPSPTATDDANYYESAWPPNAAPYHSPPADNYDPPVDDVAAGPASEGPQYAPFGPSSAPPTANYDPPVDDVAAGPASEGSQSAPFGPSSASPPNAVPYLSQPIGNYDPPIDDVATGPASDGAQYAPSGPSLAPTASWTGSVMGEQPPPLSDEVEAPIGGGGVEEMNAAEEGGGWGEKKASEVAYWVMGSACLVGFGAYLHSNKKMEDDKRRRRKWEYQSLTKRNENKREVELPILA